MPFFSNFINFFLTCHAVNFIPIMQNFLLILLFSWFSNGEPFQVSLGKAPNCNGYNFCNISSNVNTQRAENEVMAYIEKTDENHVQFSFTKKSISDKVFLKYLTA